jgi:DNA-binding GntR family transcriptional regulator
LQATKTDRIYEGIKQLILRGELSNNAAVSENALARRFQVSRTPVREAIKRLELEGFVKVIPNQGIMIKEVSINEVKEIYDLRIAIEEFVVKELAELLSEDDFRVLEESLKKQEKALEKRDAIAFHEEDRKFHDYFMRSYGNTMIVDFISKLRDRIEGINVHLLRQPGNMNLFFREHGRIFEALRRRDAEEAARAMDEHLKGGKERLLSG